MQEITQFLKEKCELLHKLNVSQLEISKFEGKPKFVKQNTHSHESSQNRFCSYYCKNNHSVFKCDKFLQPSIQDREKETQWLKLCIKCLNPNHKIEDCKKNPCRKCGNMWWQTVRYPVNSTRATAKKLRYPALLE